MATKNQNLKRKIKENEMAESESGSVDLASENKDPKPVKQQATRGRPKKVVAATSDEPTTKQTQTAFNDNSDDNENISPSKMPKSTLKEKQNNLIVEEKKEPELPVVKATNSAKKISRKKTEEKAVSDLAKQETASVASPSMVTKKGKPTSSDIKNGNLILSPDFDEHAMNDVKGVTSKKNEKVKTQSASKTKETDDVEDLDVEEQKAPKAKPKPSSAKKLKTNQEPDDEINEKISPEKPSSVEASTKAAASKRPTRKATSEKNGLQAPANEERPKSDTEEIISSKPSTQSDQDDEEDAKTSAKKVKKTVTKKKANDNNQEEKVLVSKAKSASNLLALQTDPDNKQSKNEDLEENDTKESKTGRGKGAGAKTTRARKATKTNEQEENANNLATEMNENENAKEVEESKEDSKKPAAKANARSARNTKNEKANLYAEESDDEEEAIKTKDKKSAPKTGLKASKVIKQIHDEEAEPEPEIEKVESTDQAETKKRGERKTTTKKAQTAKQEEASQELENEKQETVSKKANAPRAARGAKANKIAIEHWQASQLIEALRTYFPDFEYATNEQKPRRNSFDITLIQDDETSIIIWSGRDKTPRKAKFPDVELIISEIEKYLNE